MKSKLFIFGSLAALLATASQAADATKGANGTDLSSTLMDVWSGGGGTNGAPTSADIAKWDATSTTGELTVGSPVTWLAMNFTASVAASTTITGSKITLTRSSNDANAAILNDSGELVTINNAIGFSSGSRNTITSNIISSVSSGLTLGGSISSPAPVLFIRGSSTSLNNRIDGVITANSLTKSDTGAWSLTNANTITNGVTFGVGGTLRVGHNTALGIGNVTLAGGTAGTATLGAASGLGDRTLANNFTTSGVAGHTLAVDTTNANIRLDGNITDSSGGLSVKLTKSGVNTLTLAGTANNYSGGTTVSGGTLTVDNATALGGGTVLVNGAQALSTPSLRVNPGLTVANALTLKRGVSGTGRANIVIGAGSDWRGNITLDNTNAGGFAALLTNNVATTTASVVSGNIGVSVLGTPGSSSPTLVLRGGQLGKVTGDMSLESTGYLVITDGSNWEISGTSNTWGTLDIASEFAIVTVGAVNTLPSTGVVVSNPATPNGGTLSLNNQAGNAAFNQTIAGLSGKVKVGLTTGAATLTLDTTTNQSSSGVISGAISLDKKGAAVQTLSAANTHTGSTTISAGNLTLSNALALQNSALVTTGAGTVTLSGHTNPTFGGLSGATGNLASVVTNYNTVTSLTLNPNAGSVSYGGDITDGSGATTVTKTGAGTQVLSSTNSYTGDTNINTGTLVINGNISTSSLTTVAVGATLGGSGTVGKAVVNGTLTVGNSPGQMNFTDTLGLNGNAIMEIDGVLGAGVTGGHDFVNLTGTGAAGVLTYGGIMTLDLGVIFSVGTYSWNLFDMASETGTFTAITLADQYTGSLLDSDFDGIWNLTSGDNTWTFTESTGVLGLNVIPEPTTNLLASLLFAAGLIRRRR